MKKKLTIALAFVLVIALAVAGTVAYLTAETDPVVNTFTVGNIDITLTEEATDFKMIPGEPIDKDPVVTVEAGSEACWLFVKVEESANLTDFIDYDVILAEGTNPGWTALDNVPGVYYREVPAVSSDTEFHVLLNDKVTVLSSVDKDDMDALSATTSPAPALPTLTFTAYAVQKAGFDTAAAAWGQFSATA